MTGTSVHDSPAAARFICLNCGSPDAVLFLGDCRDFYMGKPGVFEYYRCSRCQLTQLHPIPSDMAPFYEAYQVHSKKSWLHETMRGLLMTTGYYLPGGDSPKLHVLDYGCGDGWYVAEMKGRGHSVVGFEADADHAANVSRKLDVPVVADVAALKAAHAASFDLVTMHFVVEHLADVKGAFTLAQLLLKPTGRFYFMVPNIRSMEAKLFRRKWHGLDPPRHLHFLTEDHVKDLARGSGLEIADLHYFSLPNSFSGSLSTVLAGRFVYSLFAALMLPSLLACTVLRDGNLAVTLTKRAT